MRLRLPRALNTTPCHARPESDGPARRGAGRAVGARIAEQDSGEIGALGQLLCDAGAHAAGCLDDPPGALGTLDTLDALGPPGTDWAGGRARRLDDLGELDPVLCELCFLLHEVAEALVRRDPRIDKGAPGPAASRCSGGPIRTNTPPTCTPMPTPGVGSGARP
ncbi:DUF6099 family protein [Kitasatospora sp. NPDC093679]|uniref:DUF6099 family protein n=1 Tax=Kitasatospora sp. NPDC093679 TaxID=3154983 RepID=UPI00343A5EB3